MKKVALAATGLTLMWVGAIQPVAAADMDYQPAIQQLVVSGVVETWTGYTVYSDVDVEEPEFDSPRDYFGSARSGRLSLPLSDNLSMQMDFDNETNNEDLVRRDGDDGEDDNNFRYSFQGVAHLSWRDPASGLFGIFGGAGTGSTDTDVYPVYFGGGEGQVYLGEVTLYGQAGYFDAAQADGEDGDSDSLRNAGFGRGVLRWFASEDSRWQGEVSFAKGDVDQDDEDGTSDDGYLVEWAVRYDTVLDLPLTGETNVFAGYRGIRFENEDDDLHSTDHTFMVGFRMWFGGETMKQFDRVGATLDAPNFGRWSSGGNIVDVNE